MLVKQQVEVVRFKQIATQEACQDALDNVTAVYAWFLDLTLSEWVLESKEKFVNTIVQWVANPLSEKRQTHISPFYEVGITIKSKKLSKKKENSLKQYAEKENIRKEIGSALEAATFLQAPLYVGKTKNRLADRVWEHVNRETDLSDRLEAVGLSLRDCLLVYIPISDPDDVGSDVMPLVQLIEDIVTRLTRPGFVRRIG